ncbi:MAG TPA: DEAD/DEAH box helicase, partial [Thermoleophilia bacterium]|nr:DEAD/DEAH box helicase [Thermoleophilia bacterium]
MQPDPRILYDNSFAHILDVPQGLIEALRYDLAFDTGAPPEPPTQDATGAWRAGWDGWSRMLTHQGKLASGLVPEAVRLLAKYGQAVRLIDGRAEPPGNLPLQSLGFPPPRAYQLALVEAAIHAGRGVIDAPPRSGKTLVGALIFDALALPTLWIAPTRGIVDQTVRVLRRYLGPGVKVVSLMGGSGTAKQMRERAAAVGADLVVTTQATAIKLAHAFWRSRAVLIYDEFHHSASTTGQDINRLASSIFYRFGLTGTHFRSDANTEILMRAVLSNVIGKVDVSSLVDDGHLCPADVLFVPITWPAFSGSNTTTLYPMAIVQHEQRNGWIAWAASQLAARGKRTIVLVKHVEHGERLAQLIAGSTFIHGELGSAANGEVIDGFNGGRVPVLIGTSVLGEGIDLPAADALVYAKAGRASVTITQDVYRVLTAHPD